MNLQHRLHHAQMISLYVRDSRVFFYFSFIASFNRFVWDEATSERTTVKYFTNFMLSNSYCSTNTRLAERIFGRIHTNTHTIAQIT